MSAIITEPKDDTFEITFNDFKKNAKSAKEVAKVIDDELNNHKDYEYIQIVNKNHEDLFDLQHLLEETNNLPVIVTPNTKPLTSETIQARKDKMIWEINYAGFNPGVQEYSEEALTTIGNGYFGLRGTTTEMKISDDFYTGTYVSGLYDEEVTDVEGQKVTNEDMVNLPNGQYLAIKVDDELSDFSTGQISDFKRQLNMHENTVSFEFIFTTKSGKKIQIKQSKQASFHDLHAVEIHYEITPLNFSGEITVISEIDGDVRNYNVERYRNLEQHHLTVTDQKAEQNYIYQKAETNTSKFTILTAAKITGDFDESAVKSTISADKISQEINLHVDENVATTVTKVVELFTYPKYDQKEAETKWDSDWKFETIGNETKLNSQLWEEIGIELNGDLYTQMLINLHTFHILVAASPEANVNRDVSITSRGLHGEAYRGHIFWDEVFIAPVFTFHFPKVVRESLMYRYNRLATAKQNAKDNGYQGAMFPWQSSLDGTEQSQSIHVNPMTGKWEPDNSRLQNHVSLAIAYGLIQYVRATKDLEFLDNFGLEMLFEIAKFWISKLEYDEKADRFSIDRVMGPDEFHEAYPNAKKPGLKDNAYTNILVSWLFTQLANLKHASSEILIKQISDKTDFNFENWDLMDHAAHRMNLDISQDGIVAQYAGFFDLKPLDFDAYKKKYGNIYRMDRILNKEGKSINDYQAIKQPDFLMTYYLLGNKTVNEIISRMGYQVGPDFFEKNLRFYENITTHGSSLSRVVHADLDLQVGNNQKALDYYMTALQSDYHDIQGGTTAEGIHTGVMASTYWLMIHAFGGVSTQNNILNIQPKLPEKWTSIHFKFLNEGVHYDFKITQDYVEVSADKKIDITIGNNISQIGLEPVKISYK